jgi:alkaline phosphatase
MRYFFSIIILLLFSTCTKQQVDSVKASNKVPEVKNIILLIGDGMGVTQITAGMYMNGNTLNLERCKVVGLHKSTASNNLVTDSAAGATAFACGKKTYNGAIGVGPDKQPIKTILEYAEEKGLATGLVATSTITHATPASFIAHVEQRKMMEAIAADFMKTEVDLFIGGGKKYFDNRDDNRNLSNELREKGYFISDFVTDDLTTLELPKDKNVGYFTANDNPLPAYQGRDYIGVATEKAINYLDQKNDNGFFLMVEGSQIDWGGHANNSDYIISEVIDFDKAVKAALDFAEKDGNTLVVITADHETGGYAINKGSTMDSLVTAFTTDYHTADLIPVFAFGPKAADFGGIYENTAIFDKMMKALFH